MSDWLAKARDKWTNRGDTIPTFAEKPGENQESVWLYPRPPALVPDKRLVTIRVGDANGAVLAETRRAIRVCETASPPTWYIPPEDVRVGDAGLEVVPGATSFCEWKGKARYWALSERLCGPGAERRPVAWEYPAPLKGSEQVARHFAFYADRVCCFVGEGDNKQQARSQAGGFYGGWITDDIVGPFKGEPGTGGW